MLLEQISLHSVPRPHSWTGSTSVDRVSRGSREQSIGESAEDPVVQGYLAHDKQPPLLEPP